MARTNEWTETLVDWVDGRLRQNRFANMWLGGGAGTHGGSSYRPIDGQLTQRHVCYDTSEDTSPCSPSGFSSLVDNLRRIRYWQEPATWFGVETTSGLQVYIKPGLWYPSTTEYCAFAGGNSPTFTLPGALDRIDTVYIDPSGILHIQRGTPAVSPTITLPPIASGIPLWAVYLPPTASGVYFQICSGYYTGQAYIERDLRPFLNLGGGGVAASGVPNAAAEGQALVSNAGLEWIADTTPLWKGEHSFEAGIAFVGPTTENSITIPDAQTQAFHIIDTGATEFLRIDTYNDYFIIDPAGVEIKVGIGVNPPGQALHIHGSDYVAIKLTNDDTGIVGNVGFDIGVATNEVAYLWNCENTDLMLGTNNLRRITILAGGYVGIATHAPNQQLTVEGTVDLKEQAAANADTAAYGQIWVKNTTPCELWFTDDTGTDVQLGLAGGGLPNVAAAGYVIVSTGVDAWAADQTPLWTGEHSFGAGIAFTGASGANEITIPDNIAIALELKDAGGLEYIRIVSTDANPYILLDPTEAGIKIGIGLTPATNIHIYENNADTEPALRIEQEGSGDASIRLRLVGVVSWSMGIDNSDANSFKIAVGAAANGSTFVITTTGLVGIGTPTPDGTTHIFTASAGAVAAHGGGDDLTVENSTSGGISILVPDASEANLLFGSPSDNLGALIRWEYDQLRMIVGTAHTNGVLSLCSGNAVEAIRIEADGDTFFNGGDVGIGTTPTYRLDVKDDVAAGFVAHFFNDGDNVNRYGIHVQAGADNGAAVGSTFYFLAADGDGNSTGDLLTTNGVFQLQDVSDRDRKTKIKNTKIVGLDIINRLRVRDYNWKANPKGPVMTSFVAQEAQEVFPAMIGESPNGTLMTARAMLIPILAKAIQELDARLTQGGL